MKILLLGYLLCVTSIPAFALPVLNASTPGAEMITVFPDHLDKTLHYLAPTVFVVAKDPSGVPNFSYMEYVNGSGSRRAILQTTLRPDFSLDAIERAKTEIRKFQPEAHFAALSFEDSRVNFTDALKELLVSSDCQHQAGTVGAEQTCSFKLNSKGIKVMLPIMKAGMVITTQFMYTINGVRQNADGTYENRQNKYQVAGRIGGSDLAKFPELFRGADGKAIPSERGFF